LYRSPVKPACTSIWRQRRVLVTGASGFIGHAVCHQLLAAGAEVHGTGHTQPPPSEVFGHRSTLPDDALTLMETVRPEVLIHLASPVNLGEGPDVRATLQAGIVQGTRAVAAGAAQWGARMIHVSTCAVYEGGQAPFHEDATLSPHSPYGQLKLAAERAVQAQVDLNAVVLRPFRTYGPGCREGLIAEACRAALSGDTLLLTDGGQIREWNHVDTIAAGILRAGSLTAGEVINLGGGDRRSVFEMVTRIFDLAGASMRAVQPGSQPRRPGEVDRFWGDHQRAEARWGPLPHVDLDAGLRQTLDWHQDHMRKAR